MVRCSAHSRVMLTGEGGDVILFPSPTYLYKLIKNLRWGRLAVELGRSMFIHGSLPPIGLRRTLNRWRVGDGNGATLPVWLNPDFAVRWNLKERWRQLNQPSMNHLHRPEALSKLENPFWQHYFEKVYDPASSGAPVEFRHPLLDVRVLTFALALPPVPWCVDKILVRETGRGLLPEVIRRRPKTPLAANPEEVLLRQPAARWVDHFDPHPHLARYVRREAIPFLTGGHNNCNWWINARPFSLNHWLQHQGTAAHIHKMENLGQSSRYEEDKSLARPRNIR